MKKEWIVRWSKRCDVAIIGGNLLILALCTVSHWPEWWVNVIYGKSALNWFASVELSWIGVVCLAIAALVELVDVQDKRAQRWFWLIMGAGFLFLSVEEHFRIHVRIREGLLKPNDIATRIPGVGAGDIVLICYALVGLPFLYTLFRYLRYNREARAWLLVALITGVIGVAMDARDYTGWDMNFYHKHKYVEEVLERTLSPMSFLMAFTKYFWDLMGNLLNAKT